MSLLHQQPLISQSGGGGTFQMCVLKCQKTKHQIVIQWLCSSPKTRKKEKIGGLERAIGIRHHSRMDVFHCRDTFKKYFSCTVSILYQLLFVCMPLGSGFALGQFHLICYHDRQILYMSTGLHDFFWCQPERSKMCATNLAHTLSFFLSFLIMVQKVLKEKRIV